jgi:hypothetical protein
MWHVCGEGNIQGFVKDRGLVVDNIKRDFKK